MNWMSFKLLGTKENLAILILMENYPMSLPYCSQTGYLISPFPPLQSLACYNDPQTCLTIATLLFDSILACQALMLCFFSPGSLLYICIPPPRLPGRARTLILVLAPTFGFLLPTCLIWNCSTLGLWGPKLTR